jgi:hypothetical protein
MWQFALQLGEIIALAVSAFCWIRASGSSIKGSDPNNPALDNIRAYLEEAYRISGWNIWAAGWAAVAVGLMALEKVLLLSIGG